MSSVMRGLHCLGMSLVALVVALEGEAQATPNFPSELESHYELTNLPGSPPCLLCHSNAAGGKGTVTTPFGTYLLSRGARAYDAASLRRALDADRGERHDSDGDGTPDYDDLRAGRDPNGSGADDRAAPLYGCSQAPARTSTPWKAVALAMLVWTIWRFRSRRRASCAPVYSQGP